MRDPDIQRRINEAYNEAETASRRIARIDALILALSKERELWQGIRCTWRSVKAYLEQALEHEAKGREAGFADWKRH